MANAVLTADCLFSLLCTVNSVEELTGDSAPDQAALARADILITTPEKWDGVSRAWQKRDYVKANKYTSL